MSSSASPSVITSVEAYVKALLHCQKYPTQAVSGFLIGKRITESNNTSNNNDNDINNNSNSNMHSPTAADADTAAASTTTTNTNVTNISTNNINNNNNTNSVYIADAVPLFHTILMNHPHPMLSVAYAQVSSYARTKGLVMLGYYVANERAGDASISQLTLNVLRMLQGKLSSSAEHYQPLLWTIVGASPTEGGVDVRVSYGNHNNNNSNNNNNNNNMTFGRWNSDTLSCEPVESAVAAQEMFGNAMDALKQFQLVDFEDHLEEVQLNYLEQGVPV